MRLLVGFEACQVVSDDGLQTGCLEVDEDGVVRFVPLEEVQKPGPEQANEAVKGSLGEYEEVEEPVPVRPDPVERGHAG